MVGAALAAAIVGGCPSPDTADGDRPVALGVVSADSPCSAADCVRADEIAAILSDRDRDGRTDIEELRVGADPDDPHDGPDIDGDGVANGDDPDIDGDGAPNKFDIDIDGDGMFNRVDPDMDADGIENTADPDQDSDDLSDRWDLDDDSGGSPDDEEPEDDDDDDKKKPSASPLEGLVDRLKAGALTEGDYRAIAFEIASRLETPGQLTDVFAALKSVCDAALDDTRLRDPNDPRSPDVAALDVSYRQLEESLTKIKELKSIERGNALPDEHLSLVVSEFVPRIQALAALSGAYSATRIEELGALTTELVRGLGSAADARGFTTALADRATQSGTAEGEAEELSTFIGSAGTLNDLFERTSPEDLVDAIDRLRNLAGADGGGALDRSERLAGLLGKMRTKSKENKSIDEAVSEVEDEAANDDGGESGSNGDAIIDGR